jgi:hypothetical protein
MPNLFFSSQVPILRGGFLMYGARRKKFSEFHRGACFCCLIHGVKGVMIRSARHSTQAQPTIGAAPMTDPKPQHPTKPLNWPDYSWVVESAGRSAGGGAAAVPGGLSAFAGRVPGHDDSRLFPVPWAEAAAPIKATPTPGYALQRAREEELEECAKFLIEKGQQRLAEELRAVRRPPDTSEAADAARMRWILQGNGYFMEERGLCGYGICSENEMNGARKEIDEQMAEDESRKG